MNGRVLTYISGRSTDSPRNDLDVDTCRSNSTRIDNADVEAVITSEKFSGEVCTWWRRGRGRKQCVIQHVNCRTNRANSGKSGEHEERNPSEGLITVLVAEESPVPFILASTKRSRPSVALLNHDVYLRFLSRTSGAHWKCEEKSLG